MLQFFHAPKDIELAENIRFPALRFRGSDRNRRNGVIPFSHIYVTSASQISQFINHGGIDGQIVKLEGATVDYISDHARCPINLSFRDEGIRQAISDSPLAKQDSIRLGILNGMGRGYGDNIAGLGVLQHLNRFLKSCFSKVEIDLLQRNTRLQSILHNRHDIVHETVQLPISVTQLFSYDAYIDLTDLLNIPEFNELPLYDFFINALSMQKEVRKKKDKRTELIVLPEVIANNRLEIIARANESKNCKIVLLHPSASTRLRTIPDDILNPLVREVLDQTKVILVSCVKVDVDHPRMVDMSDQSTDINAFINIIGSCDAVITVGTVVYHVSGNLNIPTLLFPTVEADVNSAKNLPSVKTMVPWGMRSKISSKHMSREKQDIDQAREVFSKIKAKNVTSFIKKSV
jgi:hypothetical protein